MKDKTKLDPAFAEDAEFERWVKEFDVEVDWNDYLSVSDARREYELSLAPW